MTAIPIASSSSEARIDVGTPTALFPAGVGDPRQTNMRQGYVVSDDGQRFLINTLVEEAAPPVTVILNWRSGR